jgi:hypothetical protein
MCDPVTLAVSAGLAAAGTGLQMAGQQKAVNAQRDAANAERIRQRGYQDQQAASVAQATDRAAAPRVEQDMAAETARREADLRAVSQPQTAYLPGQDSGPQIVRDEVDRNRSVASAFTNQQAGARANLGGWQDALFGVNRDLGRFGQDITTQSGFAQGSRALLPGDTDAARMRGQGLRTAGDLFQIGSMVAAPAAGMFRGGGALSSLFARQGGAKT